MYIYSYSSLILSFLDVESSKIGAWLFHPEKVNNKINEKVNNNVNNKVNNNVNNNVNNKENVWLLIIIFYLTL